MIWVRVETRLSFRFRAWGLSSGVGTFFVADSNLWSRLSLLYLQSMQLPKSEVVFIGHIGTCCCAVTSVAKDKLAHVGSFVNLSGFKGCHSTHAGLIR